MNIFDEIDEMLGIEKPATVTPEIDFYNELTQGKMPKIHNAQYWFKHQLFVYTSFTEKNWIVSKLSGPGRVQVPIKEVSRALLEYYFLMVYHAKFFNDRARERGMLVDLQKFLDLIIEYPTIRKLIDNPHELV